MTYGNGSDRFKPLSEAADVVAHELVRKPKEVCRQT